MSQQRRQQRKEEFFVRCASGFEQVLAQELKGMRIHKPRPLHGGVAFFGGLEDGYRACLWSRVATRVQLVLARVDAADADALYGGVRAFAWERHVRQGATLAVDAHGQNKELRNTKFTALKVKDAVCDRLREVRGERPNVDAHDPDLSIDVALHEKKATLYLNLSGKSLHRRGYREDGVQTEAPLKETLAAGVLLAAGWSDIARGGGFFADPMCGSGTLAIEAALIAADCAPGLLRTRWGFDGWACHDAQLWSACVSEAHRRKDQAARGGLLCLAGDIDPEAVQITRANAERAGVTDKIRFYVDDAVDLSKHVRRLHKLTAAGGLLASNPPYGERLSSADELGYVYAALGGAVGALPPSWQVATISPDAGVDTALGRAPRMTLTCYNGPIQTWVRRYSLADEQRVCEVVSLDGVQRRVPVADVHSEQFAARLRKVARDRARWARKAGISCYRVYDADVPEYAFSVDVYSGRSEDASVRLAHVCEYPRRRGQAQEDAQRRLADVRSLVSAVLGVDAAHVAVTPADGQDHGKGKRKPSVTAVHHAPLLTVDEHDCSFALFRESLYEDLPLAQRGVRELVASEAAGKRVAVLFAKGGAYAARAAAAGPALDVLVTGFSRRAGAVQDRLHASGGMAKSVRVVDGDVRSWLKGERQRGHGYDLVVVTPPEWMGKRDAGSEWDFNRDHPALLKRVLDVLASDGQVLLVCEDSRMQVDMRRLEDRGMVVRDLSAQVVQPDFARARDTVRAYRIRRA